jgi:hypothetical protein
VNGRRCRCSAAFAACRGRQARGLAAGRGAGWAGGGCRSRRRCRRRRSAGASYARPRPIAPGPGWRRASAAVSGGRLFARVSAVRSNPLTGSGPGRVLPPTRTRAADRAPSPPAAHPDLAALAEDCGAQRRAGRDRVGEPPPDWLGQAIEHRKGERCRGRRRRSERLPVAAGRSGRCAHGRVWPACRAAGWLASGGDHPVAHLWRHCLSFSGRSHSRCAGIVGGRSGCPARTAAGCPARDRAEPVGLNYSNAVCLIGVTWPGSQTGIIAA